MTRAILSVACLYGRRTRFRRGSHRLLRAMTPLIHQRRVMVVESVFGTRLQLAFPEDAGWESLCLFGSYERGTSELAQAILQPGDVVIDIGANLGWYSTLFSRCVKPHGAVHAFEPVPWIRKKLEENCALNKTGSTVIVNDVALGASAHDLVLYSFAGTSHGETSARPFAGSRISSQVSSKCITLDEYVRAAGLSEVVLIKVDVEGGERDVLRGSEALLSSRQPPMWILEVNFRNASAFGWCPTDLLATMQRSHGYRFVRVPSGWQKPLRVSRVDECHHGDNVLCYRPDVHVDRIGHLGAVL